MYMRGSLLVLMHELFPPCDAWRREEVEALYSAVFGTYIRACKSVKGGYGIVRVACVYVC